MQACHTYTTSRLHPLFIPKLFANDLKNLKWILCRYPKKEISIDPPSTRNGIEKSCLAVYSKWSITRLLQEDGFSPSTLGVAIPFSWPWCGMCFANWTLRTVKKYRRRRQWTRSAGYRDIMHECFLMRRIEPELENYAWVEIVIVRRVGERTGAAERWESDQYWFIWISRRLLAVGSCEWVSEFLLICCARY